MSLAACDIRCNASMHVDPTAGLFALHDSVKYSVS
jgi:hypothetical protein